MGLDSLIAGDDADDVANPFDFKWCIAPVEVFSTVCTGSLETVLHKNSPTRGLLLSKQLSKDFYNTISTENSTGNAPNSINNAQYIPTDEVYTDLEKSNAKKSIGIKTNANAQKHLTPVTIMVVDTILSVKSRILLKVLLDSGSTTPWLIKNAYLGIANHARFPIAGK